MRHSESIAALAKALAAAQAEYVTVPKSKTATVKMKSGGEFKYNYADLADCLAMAIPRLSKHGIAFSQPHVIFPDGLRVVTFLVHESGRVDEPRTASQSPKRESRNSSGQSLPTSGATTGCSFIGVAPDEDTDAQGPESALRRQRQRSRGPQAHDNGSVGSAGPPTRSDRTSSRTAPGRRY